ncbi:peptidoglycan-binding domain-containing protein [Geminocystis sp. NIES-3709]|uniref:peptidoglycan-binding domain-containing protein n=1 Tax=Geminocystis sp. NIES-3709 TaxID=1617448 RepID=UPI0005FCD904|nr:peptidoglycan-binding domain-containing protein [Geminocystis sp. NIES-3709]BAQ65542.1 carboxypeptidase [Geminocystis sp. NIES-3709]
MSVLNQIKTPIHISKLNFAQAKELQILLNKYGYNLKVDGDPGEKTTEALNKFKDSVWLGEHDWLGVTTIEALKEERNTIKQDNDHDFSTKEGTANAIISECKKQGLNLKNQIAYVLATAQWETANTFKPVKEAYWLSEDWRRKNLRYFPFYGRGFVQITWMANYQKYSRILGIDLVNFPDKVLEPNISLFILVHGCKNGVFTGMSIEDYINNNVVDFHNARRVINGIDKAQEIANIAREWARKI